MSRKLHSFSQRITRGVFIMALVNAIFVVALITLVRPILVESTTKDYVVNLSNFIREDIKYTFLVQDDVSTQSYLAEISSVPWLQSITLYSPDGELLNSVGVSNWNPSSDELTGSFNVKHIKNVAHNIDTILAKNEIGNDYVVGRIHVSIDGSSISERLNRIIYSIIGVLVLGSLFLWVLMRTYAIRATRSIRELSAGINAIQPEVKGYDPINIHPDSIEISNVQAGVNNLLRGIETNRSELENRVQERTFELASALEHNNRAESVRRSLIMNLSHDLKTPLSSIIMYLDHALEILEEDASSGVDALPALVSSRRSSVALWEEIKTLLQYSSSTDNTDNIALVSFDICHTVNRSIESINHITKGSNNNVVYRHSGTTEFVTSERLFVYILDNLLTNANKATANGVINIETSVSKAGLLTLVVHDNGVGIPIDVREHIFDKHVSIDIDNHKGPRGMGIGLSLTKFWIDQLGGTVELESDEGEFTKFVVTIKEAHMELPTIGPSQ